MRPGGARNGCVRDLPACERAALIARIVRLDSLYEFGPGQLSISAVWAGLQGQTVHGQFLGAVPGMTIQLCEQQLSDDCGDVFGLSQGTAAASLGAGSFDQAFAGVLGIAPASSGGSFAANIDGVDGGPQSNVRGAGFSSGVGEVRIEGVATASVPEPAMSGLIVVAMGAALASRRRARVRRVQ